MVRACLLYTSTPVPQITTKDETGVLAKSTGIIVDTLSALIDDECYLLESMAAGNFDVDSKDKSLYRGDFTTLLTSIENIIDKLSDTLHQINICLLYTSPLGTVEHEPDHTGEH